MSILRSLPGRSTLPWGLALLALSIFFCAPPARADTFLFSFTTQDLLTSLSSADKSYSEHGYFAIFLQPSTVSGYSFNNDETSPRPASEGYADDWQAALGAESAFTGTVVEFTRDFSSDSASLVSGANGAPDGQNIFMYGGPNSYLGSLPIPTRFGSPATITSLMPSDAVFSFEMTTSATPPSTVAFSGRASAIFSGSHTTYDPLKTDYNIKFTLNFTEIAPDDYAVVPEPRTWMLSLAGAACVLGTRILGKKRRAIGSRS